MPRKSCGMLCSGVLLTIAACGGEQGGGNAVTRDSAGITIVENSGPRWASGAGWSVLDSALVDTSQPDEPEYELDQTRGPVRLSDGRIVLFHGAANQLRFYDSNGTHLLTTGRAGSGPGEFQNVMGLWLAPGDSLLVAELLNRRLNVLDSQGKYARSFSLGGQGGGFVPVGGRVEVAMPSGVFADGSVVGFSQAFAINQARSGAFRDTITAIRYAPDGAARDTLGKFLGIEMETITMTFGAQSFSAPTQVPLGKTPQSAVSRDRLVVAQNERWELEYRDQSGALKKLVRAARTAAPVTPADIDASRKDQLEQMGGNPMLRSVPEPIKKQITARIEQAKYPETLAFFGTLLVDPDENLWAQEATSPAVREQRWMVVDSAGTWLGTVTMPRDFRPTFIGRDAVTGIWKDADAVEHVRVYRIRK